MDLRCGVRMVGLDPLRVASQYTRLYAHAQSTKEYMMSSLSLLRKKAEQAASETAAGSRVHSLNSDTICPKCNAPLKRITSGHGLPLMVCLKDRLALPGV